MNSIIFIGLGLVVSVVGLRLVFSGGDSMVKRMQDYATPARRSRAKASDTGGRLARIREVFNNALKLVQSESVYWKLTSANWQISVSEYFLIRIFVALAGFGLGTILQNALLGGLIAAVVFMVPEALLRRSIHQRQIKFQAQLLDVLLMISGAVKIGYSLQQSLDVVIMDMSPPASDEFKRVRREVGLGLRLDHALMNLSKRMESDDLNLVVTAININMQVGGSLTNMLRSVVETIRERSRLFNEIRVLTSYAKYTGYLLTAMPFITALILYMLNPDYFSMIFHPSVPRFVLLVPVVLVTLGNYAIKRIAVIKV